jgi:hypothetical protein
VQVACLTSTEEPPAETVGEVRRKRKLSAQLVSLNNEARMAGSDLGRDSFGEFAAAAPPNEVVGGRPGFP